MADIDLKTETPDTSLPATGFLFGADSQASASPSVYSTQAVATTLLGSTTLSGTTITASAPVFDFAQTWNNAAVTFTGMRFNAAGTSDANSASASLLMDLQVGSAGIFQVRKDGRTFLPTSSGIYFAGPGASNIGIAASGLSSLAFVSNSSTYAGLNNNAGQKHFTLSSDASFVWSSTTTFNGTPDLFLTRRGVANLRLGAADTGSNTATVTITIATPGVVTWSSHALSTGTPVFFTTTGALPTGITASTTYYVIAVDTNTFRIATSLANAIAGTAVNTSGSQSGTQTGNRNAITQALSVQSVTGVTNRPGADLLITGSQGTGTGAGGSIVFQVAPAGSSGTAQNALATALTIDTSRNITIGGDVVYSSGFALKLGISGLPVAGVGVNYFALTVDAALRWTSSSTTDPSATADLILRRDAANTLALRNGTAAQEFRVYETTTGTIYKAILGNRQLMKIAGAAFDNGAGASAGTLSNAPAVGNPTKWIPIDDNGTTRYIPAW